MISGVALFDYDGDGWLDIYVVNGATMPGLDKTDPKFHNRLFRNRGDGTFEDVTAQGRRGREGLRPGRRRRPTTTTTAHADLFVAGLRQNIALPQPRRRHVRGRDRARRARASATPTTGRCGRWPRPSSTTTRTAGSTCSSPTTASGTRRPSRSATGPSRPDYCHPDGYKGLPNSLYHNNGDGTFTDVSVAGRHPRARRQGHGRRRRRLRRRRLARPVRLERQRAGLPLPQPEGAALRGGRPRGRRRLHGARQGDLGHGRRRPRLRQRRPRRHLPDRARRRDDAALPQRGRR